MAMARQAAYVQLPSIEALSAAGCKCLAGPSCFGTVRRCHSLGLLHGACQVPAAQAVASCVSTINLIMTVVILAMARLTAAPAVAAKAEITAAHARSASAAAAGASGTQGGICEWYGPLLFCGCWCRLHTSMIVDAPGCGQVIPTFMLCCPPSPCRPARGGSSEPTAVR